MVSLRELIEGIETHRDAMRDLLMALVSIPTENPPATGYGPCVDLLESALGDLGLECQRIDIPSPADPARTAIRAWVGVEGPALYFHGHYDVVPATSPEQFRPRLEGDALFGRGSSDMKGGLVAMIYAARALQSAGIAKYGRVELLIVPDEETGGAYGSGALARTGRIGCDGIGMLLPEPTSGVVWHGNRGAVTVEVTVKGRAAHVALQHQGVNAVERALPLLHRLFDFKREIEARSGSIVLVGGRVDAGSNFNAVPAECRFTIDRRTNPDEDLEAEKQRLFDLLDRARGEGVDLEVRTIQEGRSSSTPPDIALGRALSASVAYVTSAPPAFELCPGLLETRFYTECGVPAFAYGPGILAVSHGPKEFVKLNRMVDCAKVYALTAARMLTDGQRNA